MTQDNAADVARLILRLRSAADRLGYAAENSADAFALHDMNAVDEAIAALATTPKPEASDPIAINRAVAEAAVPLLKRLADAEADTRLASDPLTDSDGLCVLVHELRAFRAALSNHQEADRG